MWLNIVDRVLLKKKGDERSIDEKVEAAKDLSFPIETQRDRFVTDFENSFCISLRMPFFGSSLKQHCRTFRFRRDVFARRRMVEDILGTLTRDRACRRFRRWFSISSATTPLLHASVRCASWSSFGPIHLRRRSGWTHISSPSSRCSTQRFSRRTNPWSFDDWKSRIFFVDSSSMVRILLSNSNSFCAEKQNRVSSLVEGVECPRWWFSIAVFIELLREPKHLQFIIKSSAWKNYQSADISSQEESQCYYRRDYHDCSRCFRRTFSWLSWHHWRYPLSHCLFPLPPPPPSIWKRITRPINFLMYSPGLLD